MNFIGESFINVLNKNILSFWSENMVDYNMGGFIGKITGNNEKIMTADKSIILNARILWSFSAAFNTTKNPAHLAIAYRAYGFIKNNFLDKKLGGLYWMLSYDRRVVSSKKQIYAQAFGIYALSEFYRASKQEGALTLAKELFHLVEEHSYDHRDGGYIEAFDHEWKILDDFRLSDKDLNAAKTMNTHLHVLEAYTNLFRAWPDKNLEIKIKSVISNLINDFMDSSGHFNLFFDSKWNLIPSVFSYGHDIEAAWLIADACETIKDLSLLSAISPTLMLITEAALEGLDVDGGMMYEGRDRYITNTDKHWWPQAEAMIGLMNAWKISGKAKYYILAEKSWDYISKQMIDKKDGEWHGCLTKNGIVKDIEDKAGPWKCPYHNARAMIELEKRMRTEN